MGFSQLFTDVITKLESIPADIITPNPKVANNYQKTPSNINRKFQTINIWNDQIDNEIKEKENYIIKCPAVFIEFIPEEPKMIGGGFTQYMYAKMYFHIFSDQLNSSNLGANSFASGNAQASGDAMDRNLEIYALRDLVKSYMLGFHTHNSSYMMSRYDALDYKHNQIAKYLLGFTFCFNDEKGSISDQLSSRYIQSVQLQGGGLVEITPKNDWISGNSYIRNISVVYFNGNTDETPPIIAGWYLCRVSNKNTVFVLQQWQYLAVWVIGSTYSVGDYIYFGLFCYQCSTANSDSIFNPSNWNVICRI